MRMCCFKTALTLAGASVTLAYRGAAAIPPPVPPSFQALYNTLDSDLHAFNTTLNGLWNGAKYPVLYSGTLSDADANLGPPLLNSGYLMTVDTQVRALKALGNQAVVVEVDFPMLYQPFFSSQTQYQQFVSFYKQVAAAVRAQGMKLVVQNQILPVTGGWGKQLSAFYPTLNWTAYQAARAQAAGVIALTMRPDYMVLAEEPDTEALNSGQANVNTVSGSTHMLDLIHSSVLMAAVVGLQAGAGVGTWLPGFQGFINSFTGQNCSAHQPCVTIPLDFVDMHVLPVNSFGPPKNVNFLNNALTIAGTAAAVGKPVTMAEAWMWKVRDSEWNVLSSDQIMARNVFSFWTPLDAYFLETMGKLANYAKMTFMAPLNSDCLSAYLTYGSNTSRQSPGQLASEESSEAGQHLVQAHFTATGLSYYGAIVSPPDTIPPSAPASLTATSNNASSALLRWNASNDNVGVAGYHVWRNGVQLPDTALLYFHDSGLTGGTTYTYQVEAFDLASNASAPAIVSVTTP